MSPRWSTATRFFVVALMLLLFGVVIYWIRPLLSPLIIAGLTAYLLYPLVERLNRHPRFSYKTAVLLTYLPFVAILIATPSTLIPLLVRQLRTLSDELQLILLEIEALASNPIVILDRTISPAQLANFINEITTTFTPAATQAIDVIEATSTSLVWLLLILVTAFYLLRDWHDLHRWFFNLVPETESADLHYLLQEINAAWRAYLRGTLALMLMMGIFFTITGLALGLPGAVAIGLLTGVLSIIPELGPIIAGIVASLVALFQGSNYLPLSNFWFAVLIISIYIVVMQIKSFWIRPFVMGRFMHMNTGLVFVAIIGAALLSGILAALIILPVIASISLIGHYIHCRLTDISPWPITTPPAPKEKGSTVTQRSPSPANRQKE